MTLNWRTIAPCPLTFMLTLAASSGFVPASAQEVLTLPSSRPTRWLEVRELGGEASARHGGTNWHTARLGDLLLWQGDGIRTGENSEASLSFDDGIGSIRVFEESRLEILTLTIDAEGGKITEIDVPEGTARFQIRRLNRPSSTLTIQSPAGIAGVRGTDFGVGITPMGRTAVATFEGAVVAEAEGLSVNVDNGTYSILIPGEVPTEPDSLSGADVDLGIPNAELVAGAPVPTARIEGKVFPINLVYVNGEVVETNVSGEFTVDALLDDLQMFLVEVRSPSGEAQSFQIEVTEDDWTRTHILP
ncbi:MAG: FecR family protein [Cyanobacteria bacterium P01_E01_bin.34]